jgi:tetratricopeptide (TPR) repeat protein
MNAKTQEAQRRKKAGIDHLIFFAPLRLCAFALNSGQRRRGRFIPMMLTIAALAATASSTPTAAARPADAPSASLKASGDALMRDKRYGEALAAYEAAAKSSPDPVLHYNRGRALQFLGRYPEALASLRRFQAEAPASVRARVPLLDEIVAEVRSHVAALRVRCNVAGARVLLGRQEIGLTPFVAPLPVDAGRATLEIVAEGYLPSSMEVDLKGDEAANDVEVTLVSRSHLGVLVIKSGVAGARAEVDGRSLGAAPAETPLEAGEHAVAATREGYGPVRTHVVIVAGERRELVLDPLAPTPLYKRWWLWTALGAVAAGAVVTVVAVKTERPPPIGTFSPGQVRF